MLEMMGFAELGLPTGSVLLLGRSSVLCPSGAGAPRDAGGERYRKASKYRQCVTMPSKKNRAFSKSS